MSARSDEHIRAKCFHPSGNFVEFPKEDVETSVPERFQKIVRMYSDRIAIKTKDRQITYDELNSSANRVAHAILAQRGESQEGVAILCDNNVPLIVSIIGALKTGRFFVPLDSALPKKRLQYMLNDSRAGLVVTDNSRLALVKELAHKTARLINIDDLDSELPEQNPNLSVSPDTLARVLYTSGSTGQPKGVIGTHRNLLHNTMTRTNNLHICPEDRLILFLSVSSQVANTILGALLTGARLCPFNIRDEGTAQLATWLINEEITVYISTASLFRHLASTVTGTEQFPTLRLIRPGSEKTTVNDVELYRRHFSAESIFVTSFGTTETGPCSLYFIDKSTQITGDTVPVGYPVQDVEIVLLGEDGRQVGLNQIGEIAVASRYLSPGYWQRPDLTKSKFLLDRTGADKRIYLTGDLGRILPDGCLEHLGRKDFQVKIRGNRIEVDEIERMLIKLSDIKEAVVVTRENQPGDTRLIAYFVSTSERAPKIPEMRRFLSQSLPGYMIPSVFVRLDRMPLTSSGKVDRQALPIPDNSRPELGTPFTAPRNSIEKELATIWAEVLGLDRIGIHDNFFDLGGHSLAAARVISRVIKTVGLDLPLQSLFNSPTIAEMAEVVAEHQDRKLGDTELEKILNELESLSDEQAQRLLSNQSKRE